MAIRRSASKVLHTGTGVDLRIDPSTSVIVGLQIEAVRKQAVESHPLAILLVANLAELLGINDDALKQLRNRAVHASAGRDHAESRQGASPRWLNGAGR